MSEVVLQDLMTICVDGPVMEDFDAIESINLWQSEGSGTRHLDGHRAKCSSLAVTSASELPSKATSLTSVTIDMILRSHSHLLQNLKTVSMHEIILCLFCFQFLIYQTSMSELPTSTVGQPECHHWLPSGSRLQITFGKPW